MTELKKNNKRSIDTSEKKPGVKKFKPSAPSDKPGKDGKSFKNGKPKFEGKFDKSKKFDGKFDKNKKFDGKYDKNKKFDGKYDKNKKFGKPGAKPETQAPMEKPNWNELKAKKKDLKIQRRTNKSKELYDIDVQAKKIYEELKM
jgi:hypothetical protein